MQSGISKSLIRKNFNLIKKIVNNIAKEDFKTYNVNSLISYYFFDSMSNYMESLEFI